MSGFSRSDSWRAVGAVAAVAVVTLVLAAWLHVSNAATISVTYLLLVLPVAATARLAVAAVTSIAAMLSLNFFFLPPVRTFTIADPHNWVDAVIIIGLIPLALKGIAYKPLGAAAIPRRHLRIYGLGGVVLAFVGIKAIDIVLVATGPA
jgi:K+-sensing histidine kinase KdpD